ncbi:hypothetical protein OJAV_G00114800 [Oryzias javanicus]|uniref:Phostensin/Taperin PP1-binding domain-containing protein n=1 Tax=Oryzias javanicus TaxID=123683 RepID=A0A437CWS5_ORYJA|nr:hypothetical protein OJAV_G00114800 [Oryzias javanicus]
MPAWKRGIIQRRRAKQETAEKDRDFCLPQDSRSPSDGLSDTDSSVTVNLGSDVSLSPDPGQWLDLEPKAAGQVSVETIVPVHENPFMRTQSGWNGRKGRDGEPGNEPEVKEREKMSPRGQDAETRRRFRDLNEGCEKEKDFLRIRKDPEEKESQPPSAPFSPVVPCLRTIHADNIIIIEQDRKGGEDRRGKWTDADGEKLQEDQIGKRGMKMDLREILAGGGSVTEIRASEVLIIKPVSNPEDRCSEVRTDVSRMREKEKPWGHATVINKDSRKDSWDDNLGQLPPARQEEVLRRRRRQAEDAAEDPQTLLQLLGSGVGAAEGRVNPEDAAWKDKSAKLKPGCARLLQRDRFAKLRDEKEEDADEGFTRASVKSTEGVSFAKRVPIRQDGKSRGDREQPAEVDAWREVASSGEGADLDCRRDSAFTETSCMGRAPHRGPEWSGTGPQGPYLTVLSPQTEDLISKIEKLGDATVHLNEPLTDGDCGPRSPKKIPAFGTSQAPLTIQIPRTVFYVAEETKLGRDVQDWDAGRGVERTDSWRIGTSLSRIESLREKMRQKEAEKTKQGRGEGAEETRDPEDRYWERASETQEEQRRPTEGDALQEETAEPTSTTAADVRQEVCALKSCPQLPVSLTQADTVEEVSSDCATAAAEVISDSFQTSEHEEDSPQHVGDQLSHSEEEEEEYSSSFDSEPSLSPSPPHPNSLAAMSRIYNLETVGSRSGLCLRENVSSSVHLVKVKPLVASSPPADGVQLKEQEAPRSIEGKGLHSPKAGPKHQKKNDEKVPPTPQPKQTVTIVPSFLRNPSSENSLKPANCAPTPASSPISQSPCASPSPTPSPVLFSIKSASGGHVKRGATITVTPKKPCAGGGVTTRPTVPQQTSPAAADPARKKYPTVEEIEVIGGYQNLERSCLIKSKGTPKRGKVCFHEDQLEQVCEYPSETSMLTFNPLLHDGGKTDKPPTEEGQDEEGEAGLLKSTRGLGIAPRLRVDESCPR